MQILTRHNRVIDACATGYIYMGGYVLCEEKQKAFYDCTPVTVNAIPNDLEFYDYYYIDGKFVREFPVYQAEHFSDSSWLKIEGAPVRYKLTIKSKRPIIAIYMLKPDGTYSLVTNTDITIALNGSQTIETAQAFTGYAMTL